MCKKKNQGWAICALYQQEVDITIISSLTCILTIISEHNIFNESNSLLPSQKPEGWHLSKYKFPFKQPNRGFGLPEWIADCQNTVNRFLSIPYVNNND